MYAGEFRPLLQKQIWKALSGQIIVLQQCKNLFSADYQLLPWSEVWDVGFDDILVN